MKRVGHLWENILEGGNLRLAFFKAARGKRNRAVVQRYELELDQNLKELREALVAETFELGRVHAFEIFDPKRRTIHAAAFEERVFHHALMNVCEPVFERHLIHHTYACRREKGRLKALEAAQRFMCKGDWYLKLDIRKYFESIEHEKLMRLLRRLIKDRMVLSWFEKIINSHRSLEGKGVPIGSLTSQHLANLYLSRLDRRCESMTGVSGYVRYMDDFVLWSHRKADLLHARGDIYSFLRDEMGLSLKVFSSPQRTATGMAFLGFRLYPTYRILSRRSRLRYEKRLQALNALYESCALGEASLQRRLSVLTAFTLDARAWHCRRTTLEKFGTMAVGFEPGDSGRQLEQQREQLPCGEPQQQRADEPQQQHRVPGFPQLRPSLLNGVIQFIEGLNRLLSLTLNPEGNYKPGAVCIGRYLDRYAKIQNGTAIFGH